MHDLVEVDAVVVGDLLVVAVAAGVQQHLVLLVLLRVQHVVALLTELDAHEAGGAGPSSGVHRGAASRLRYRQGKRVRVDLLAAAGNKQKGEVNA